MKIGIFMVYGPNTQLGKEGLGRYVGNLLRGFIDGGHQVVIAIPQWSEKTVNDLLKDFSIGRDQVELSILRRIPVAARGYSLLVGRKKKRKQGHGHGLLKRMLHGSVSVLEWVLSITDMLLFFLISVLLLVCGLIALPFILLGAICVAAVICVKRLLRLVKRSKGWNKTKKTAKPIKKEISKIIGFARAAIVDMMLGNVSRLLAKKAAKTPVDVWFVPTLFWPQVSRLPGTRVITAPDLVTREFPLQFSEISNFPTVTKGCLKTLQENPYFITYCDYSKTLMCSYASETKEISVIPHPVNDLRPLIDIDKSFAEKLHTEKDLTKAFSNSLMYGLWSFAAYNREEVCNFNFSDTHYIFYASQARPHKNLLNLIRAYEELLRHRYVKVKLVLTCDLKQEKAAYDYVMEHKLHYDVLCFCGLPAQMLAALYYCADLVVNPTLYEGGFPFTFGEGMSVGTPSMMSDIPQVRGEVEKYGLEEKMLFDPYDWKNMADKIQEALKDTQGLYSAEKEMYDAMVQHNETVVAAEYVAAFQHFIDEDKKKCGKN